MITFLFVRGRVARRWLYCVDVLDEVDVVVVVVSTPGGGYVVFRLIVSSATPFELW